MKNGLLVFSKNDVVRSVLNAVVAGVLLALVGIVQGGNFDLFTLDWLAVGKVALNAGFIAFVGSFATVLGTTNSGRFLGSIKTE